MSAQSSARAILSIQSTAGAVPIKNDKGELYMEKVRVQRYVAGKKPVYAQGVSSDDEDDMNNEYYSSNEPSRRDKAAELAAMEELALVGEYPSERSDRLIAHTHQKRSDLSTVFPLAKTIKSRAPHVAEVTSDRDSEEEEIHQRKHRSGLRPEEIMQDPRLRRLMREQEEESAIWDDEEEDRVKRHKRLRDPEFVQTSTAEEAEVLNTTTAEVTNEQQALEQLQLEDDDEEQALSRREMIRERALLLRHHQPEEEELCAPAGIEEAEREERLGLSEGEDDFEDDADEEESDVESEEDYGGPPRARRLKPTFVRKRDRVTLQAARKEQERAAALQEQEQRRIADERRRQTLKMLSEANKVQVDVSGDPKKAALLNKPATSVAAQATAGLAPDVKENEEAARILAACNALDSSASEDEINEEVEYEAWKVRELARIRRDRQVIEQREKEMAEVERLRQLTEEELRQELKRRPRKIVNKADKGKYKFLQKYYHRGAFFVQDVEDRVFQQDFAQPTLEDHFDKTRLPKVMQVKNFGMAGRTKYTHLVDQDTTLKRGPNEEYTSVDTLAKIDFHKKMLGGGEKQVFDRPSAKKRKL